MPGMARYYPSMDHLAGSFLNRTIHCHAGKTRDNGAENDRRQRHTRETIVKRIKICLAVDSPLLSALLRERIESEGGVVVVEESVDPIQLLTAVGQTQADVVIQIWPQNGAMPGVCSQLFMEYPDLVVVGLLRDSDRAVVCRQTITKTEHPSMGIQDLLCSVIRQPIAETV
jgi:hypothetical protein